MVVKVIGEDNAVKKEISCNNCAARLEYTNQDVFIHRYSAMGHTESDAAIKCARCGHLIFVRGY